MREILFRGKHDSDTAMAYKESWCYGVPYVDCDGDYVLANEGGGAVVIPQTVGQYTGLNDKNGTRIFEGDFIQVHGFIFVVKFGKCGGVQNVEHEVGYVGFYVEPVGENAKLLSDSGLRTDILYWINDVGVEVIGNIHDNPELLETN
ncbi:MAG: YopX family protein [Oscillospiraceae bacterium]